MSVLDRQSHWPLFVWLLWTTTHLFLTAIHAWPQQLNAGCGFRAAATAGWHCFSPQTQQQLRSSRLFAIQEATLGMGCFWKPAEELLKVPGVVETIAGYTGHPNATTVTTQIPPTYETVCFGRDWVEAVRVRYDDEQISYTQLLEAFFEVQEPKASSRQYASIVFVHSADQQATAHAWLQREQQNGRVRARDGLPVALTKIALKSPFYRAEEYHQRYWQKFRPRVAAAVALLAVNMGALDTVIPWELQRTVHTGANAVVLLGLAFVLLERVIDTKTVEM
jgi:peptide-methionine (S)-S-oxide reductase